MNVWTWIVVGFVLTVVALVAWTLWHQRRMFPPGSKRVGEPGRERGLPWIGNIYGGGRG